MRAASNRARQALAWYRLRRGLLIRWSHLLTPGLILLALLVLRRSELPFVETLQFRAFDTFQTMRPREYQDAGVRVIDIDEESLRRIGQWPWPRTTVAKLVERLQKAGAAAIAFDVVFSEPDRTSPGRVVDTWPDVPELWLIKDRAKKFADHDDLLAKSFAKGRVVTGFALLGQDNGQVPEMKASLGVSGAGLLRYLHEFQGAIKALPQLEKAAAGNGCFGYIPEHDGVVRRAPVIFRVKDEVVPSLAAEALRVAQDEKMLKIKISGGSGEDDYGGRTGIVKIKIGNSTMPTDPNGRLWVYFTKDAPERTIPAWKILDKQADLAALEGVVAFVGTSAAGLKDLRPTPLSPTAPGVDVHANAAEQMILGKYLERPDWAMAVEMLYMLVLGLLLIATLPRLSGLWSAWLAAAGLFGAVRIPWEFFVRKGILLDPVFPALTVVCVYITCQLISYLKSENERRQVRSAFGQYLHPKLVEELAKHPEKLRLGGETRQMTVLFSDIRGFTTISEQLDAHGLTQFINKFLTPMTAIIMERYGYIDKYIGDCIMAFWNAPADDPDHIKNACESALKMLEKLRELNIQWEAEAEAEGRKYIPIHVGVGLNTGPCNVGNMGADQKFNYSVLGDDVNLSSRLEGQSKYYGVETVIGPATKEGAPDYATLELDLIRVKGKTRPVRIFTLLGRPEMERDPEFRAHRVKHDAMLAAYRAREFSKAEQLLEECRKTTLPLKAFYDLYAKRLKAYLAAAPEPDWDGTFTATSK
jgi:adenylate cyclase